MNTPISNDNHSQDPAHRSTTYQQRTVNNNIRSMCGLREIRISFASCVASVEDVVDTSSVCLPPLEHWCSDEKEGVFGLYLACKTA